MADTHTSEITAGGITYALEVTHDEVKVLAGSDKPTTTRMTFRVRDGGGSVRQKGVVTHDRGIAFAKNDRAVGFDELTRALITAEAPLEAPKAKSKVTSQEGLKKQAKPKRSAPKPALKPAAPEAEPKAKG